MHISIIFILGFAILAGTCTLLLQINRDVNTHEKKEAKQEEQAL